jgi:hypothetical protein
MDIVRWVFHDPSIPESWTVPINPNSMTDPEAKVRAYQFGTASRSSSLSNQVIRTFESPSQPASWEFGGVIHTQEHHDELERWARKPMDVQITDHLERTWHVVMKSFEPTERRPTPNKPWRFTYSMHALILGRLA